MQLTIFTDYGLRTLMFLTAYPDRLCSVREIADQDGISYNHLVKVTHRLAQLGFIASTKGKGGGEAVTLKLRSGLKSTTLTGVSRHSANFEMTGGVEIRAVVARTHPVFGVLGNGSKVTVSGPIKPAVWPTKGLKAKVTTLLKSCGP